MEPPKLNRVYLLVVLLSMLVLPLTCMVGARLISIIEHGDFLPREQLLTWLVFWGVGVRLVAVHIVMRELEFAKLTIGGMACASLFLPEWRLPAACMGIFFYGVAAIQHMIKRPATANQWIALVSDGYISIVLLLCIVA